MTSRIRVVCDWIGNSQAVAKMHYLQTTDAHFADAIGSLVHRAVQSPAGTSDQEQTGEKANEEFAEKRDTSSVFPVLGVGDAGLEPATSTL